MEFANGLAVKHGVEGDQLVDVDWLELKFGCNPLDGLAGDEAEAFLEGVEEHQGGAALFGVMGDELGIFPNSQVAGLPQIELSQQLLDAGAPEAVGNAKKPTKKIQQLRMFIMQLPGYLGAIRSLMGRPVSLIRPESST